MTLSDEVPQPLFSQTFGQGPRKVFAIHCTLARSGAWRGLAAQLQDEVTITAVDMLSHGRSPDWDRQGDFHDRMTQATAPFLEPGMDLIGHSFGATVALRLAGLYPEKVRSLTLIEPVLMVAAGLDHPEMFERILEEERPVFEAIERGDEALGARLFNRKWSEGGPRWPEMSEAMRQGLTRSIHVVPASSPTSRDDRPGLLKPEFMARISMPVLLLSGETTNPIVPAINAALQSRLPNAVCEVIAGAGHMLPITHTSETAEAVRKLFARSE